jgi:ribosomal protein S18 acetylase RimI-like enzyme
MATIKELIQPDDEQLKEIRAVEEACKSYDGLKSDISLDAALNFDKNMKSLFLLYEGSSLISFLTIFSPSRDEAEISAMTLPEYRNRGYFKALFEKALEEIKKYGVGSVLFVCERCSDAGFETVVSYGARLDHTEYSLKFKGDAAVVNEYPYRLEFCRCTDEDIEALVELNDAIFDRPSEEGRSIILKALHCENRKQFAVKFDGRYIGMSSAGEEEGGVTIFGLGILPEYQGRGFGRELLYLTLKYLTGQGYGSIGIEVDSLNGTANSLYTKSGFEPEATVDYYKKMLS